MRWIQKYILWWWFEIILWSQALKIAMTHSSLSHFSRLAIGFLVSLCDYKTHTHTPVHVIHIVSIKLRMKTNGHFAWCTRKRYGQQQKKMSFENRISTSEKFKLTVVQMTNCLDSSLPLCWLQEKNNGMNCFNSRKLLTNSKFGEVSTITCYSLL